LHRGVGSVPRRNHARQGASASIGQILAFRFAPMLEFFNSSAKLVAHSGSILLPDEGQITRKLAMLFEGQM
jgi:hypothetical protein